ncbi:MAG TPA: ATP-binding protein [Nitrospira sp.]|nr:ATP-binding protein [Nitrospira sp.]
MNEQLTPLFGIRAGLMLAATYVAMGKLGLMLAIQPGYASGIFPPAGLAIAAAYLWGGQTLPWIVLGSLTLNLSVTTTPVQTSAIMAAICIAIASALQAWIGRLVLQRTIGLKTGLETIGHIGGYLLATPFICLVGASLSVASLVILSIMPSNQAFVAWMTWAIGDTLGTVSVFPIMLALFGTPDSVWKGRRVVVASVMAAVLLLVGLAYVSVRQIESAKMTQSFHFQANRLARTIQDHFDEQLFILNQLDTAFSISQHELIDRESFRALAQPALTRFPMLQAIEWVPEIALSRRTAFEAFQKKSISEFMIRHRNEEGALVSAPDRPTYYPVTYIEPLTRNEKALGFDLGSHPSRMKAVLQALQSDTPIATEPVTLVQEQESQTSVLLLKRIREGPHAPSLVLTVLRIGDFLKQFLPNGEDMDVTLTDVGLKQVLYETHPSQPMAIEFLDTLQFGGREYRLQVRPSARFVASYDSFQSWSLLVGGVITAGLVGSTLLLITGTTNRVRMQVNERTQELAMKSDLLQAVIDTVPVRVFWKDRASRYLGGNPAFARDAGLSDPSELLGKSDYDLVWANEAGRYQADDTTVIESESPRIAFDEPQTTPSGHTAWLRTSKVPLKDRNNQVIGVLGMYEDVSAQRTTETRLRESEERFTLAMQAATDGLWDWNIQTQSTYLSPQWKAMLGYADHELDNSFATWERLVDEDDRVWTMALIHDCLCGKSNGFKTEFQMRHKDGRLVDILSRAMIVRDQNGKPLRMVGTHVDITEHYAVERQLEQAARIMEEQNQALAAAHEQATKSTEAKSIFLASMSHEIRTPLNAIVGMADMLQETSLSQDQADYVQRFSRAADHLMALVNNILDLSKIEAGELQLEQICFNPRELVNTVRDLMGRNAETKQLVLDTQIQPDVPSTVIGDPTRLRQILLNLVGNAIKFTERGQVVLTVHAIPPDRVRFTVSDTGIGIPSDKLPFIFESFTQGDATTTRKFGGTGLGLSICQQLVSLMQGQLKATSTIGVGSTFEFTVRLPSVIDTVTPPSNSHVQGQTEPISAPSSRPLNILVVDDLEDNRAIVTHYLKNSSYAVEMAENGQMAVEKFQTGRYDLVLMDVQMPLMDGLQATSAIRQWERAHHRTPTPILALTAYALEEEAKKSLDAGCTAHLTKPIKKRDLLRAILDYTAPDTERAA